MSKKAIFSIGDELIGADFRQTEGVYVSVLDAITAFNDDGCPADKTWERLKDDFRYIVYTGSQCFMYCPIQQEDFGGVRFPLLADVRALFEPFARSHPPSSPPEFGLHCKLSVAP